MEKRWSVYAHINKNNGMVYVGITSQELSQRFRKGKGYKRSVYFSRAIEKYGWDAFDHITLATGLSEKSAKEIERIVIASLRDEAIPLYNLTAGGEGMIGSRLSDEAIERIRKANLGRKFSLEHRRHISESRIGRFCGKDNPHYIPQVREYLLNLSNVTEVRQCVPGEDGCVSGGGYILTDFDGNEHYCQSGWDNGADDEAPIFQFDYGFFNNVLNSDDFDDRGG